MLAEPTGDYDPLALDEGFGGMIGKLPLGLAGQVVGVRAFPFTAGLVAVAGKEATGKLVTACPVVATCRGFHGGPALLAR
jgi:hypothetical protein